ncbi:MAG: hypothetical protein WBP58_04080 [Chitinophagaceae bacterium]
MKKFIAIVFAAVYLVACGPSQKVTSSWKSPEMPNKKYNSVFIMAMIQNQSARNIIETDLANAAAAKGLKVYKSSEYFAPNFQQGNLPGKQEIIDKVRSLGCEAMMTVSLVDKESETRYVPGTTTVYAPYGRYGYGWGGYYGYGMSTYNPGYYTTDKTYFMESHIFDVESEKMIWSAQSEAYNPTSISKFSRDYTTVLADRISKDLAKK